MFADTLTHFCFSTCLASGVFLISFGTQKGKNDVLYSLCNTYLNAVTEIQQSE